MALRGGTPEQAFSILSGRSQNSNVKLSTVAAQLVEAATLGKAAEVLSQWARRTRQLDLTP